MFASQTRYRCLLEENSDCLQEVAWGEIGSCLAGCLIYCGKALDLKWWLLHLVCWLCCHTHILVRLQFRNPWTACCSPFEKDVANNGGKSTNNYTLYFSSSANLHVLRGEIITSIFSGPSDQPRQGLPGPCVLRARTQFVFALEAAGLIFFATVGTGLIFLE